ncbi:hypothetical protein RB595_008155 [Gaeumannomyces hyphopodioides]
MEPNGHAQNGGIRPAAQSRMGQRRGTTTTVNGGRDPQKLRQQLRGHQIYFIVLSIVIGSGIFNTTGEALRLSGSMGLLTAVLIFGTVAVAVGETVAELVQLFPVPNAIFEYVDTFVDHDAAWAVGVLYWFTYASIVPYQVLNATKMLRFWLGSNSEASLRIFAAIAPFVLLIINLADVVVFGWIETISGAIKLALVLVISVLLYIVADKGGSRLYSEWGFEDYAEVANSRANAFCYALPLVSFSYIGIETFAMAAFEARKMREIRLWSQLTHWTVIVVYFLCTLGIILTVPWEHHSLPLPYDPSGVLKPMCNKVLTTSAVVIGATTVESVFGKSDPCNLGVRLPVASAVTGILMFTTLSAANASLYVASRTLYGLTYQGGSGGPVRRWLQRNTGVVWQTTGAPAMALFVSLMSWYFIIYLDIARASGTREVSNLLYIISVSQNVSTLLVWAAICLAYIRFRRWTYKCKHYLAGDAELERFLKTSQDYPSRTVLSWLQPLAAYYVIAMCLVIFIFTSSSMWLKGANGTLFLGAYLPHIFLLAMVAGRKLYYRKARLADPENAKGWVHLGTDRGGTELLRKLRDLDNLSQRAADRQLDEGDERDSAPQEDITDDSRREEDDVDPSCRGRVNPNRQFHDTRADMELERIQPRNGPRDVRQTNEQHVWSP